jgi:hypothetical protein
MQKTVIILVQAQDVNLLPGQPLVIITDSSLRDLALAASSKTNSTDKSTIHNESAPAFWTWFVENPRPIRRDEPA